MGSELKRLETDDAAALAREQGKLADLAKSKEWELAKSALDVAGVVDPTPTSDAASMLMSIAEGDLLGVALSAVSMVPYLGDLLGKGAKGARLAAKLEKIAGQIGSATTSIEKLYSKARRLERQRESAAKVVKQRADDAAARMRCKTCKPTANRFGSQLPTTGKWKGEKGNSRWTSDDGSVAVDYKNGYPDWSTSTPPSLLASVEIPMSGIDSKDFSAARAEMRRRLEESTWPGNRGYKPDDYTWHHKEDGVTMELVRSEVHDKAVSGAAHSGGASIVQSAEY